MFCFGQKYVLLRGPSVYMVYNDHSDSIINRIINGHGMKIKTMLLQFNVYTVPRFTEKIKNTETTTKYDENK